jgi:hypothetical protein
MVSRNGRPRQAPPRFPLRDNHIVGRRRDQRRSPRGARGQHAVVQNQVDPRPRRQHRQPLQQLQRIKAQMGRAIRPVVLNWFEELKRLVPTK